MSEALFHIEEALRAGRLAMLIDDLDERETGHLFCAAARCTEERINQLINAARGVVIAPISEGRLKELYLHPSQQAQQRDVAIAVEARFGVSTGVSAGDRAKTLLTLAHTTKPRTELVIPGHIFPHLSKEGGVLVRAAAAEAATDLLQRAGLSPVAALAKCLDTAGAALRGSERRALAVAIGAPVATISELLCDRLTKESLVEQVSVARLPLPGMEDYSAIPFLSKIDGAEHLALVRGDITSAAPVLVRVQSEERIADLFGFGPRDSRSTMARALQRIDQEGRGVFVYIRHPRRGIVARQVAELGRPLSIGVEAANPAGSNADSDEQHAPLAESPVDTEMEDSANPGLQKVGAGTLREYGIGTQILKQLGIRSLRLLSSRIHPIVGIESFQIEVSSQEML